MIAALTLAAALSGPLPPAYGPACPEGRARYVLRSDPGISLSFHPYPLKAQRTVSDLYAAVHSRKTGKTYWFMMDWGSASIVFMYPIRDPATGAVAVPDKQENIPPYDSMTLWEMDKNLNFSYDGPESNTVAKKYIFIPEFEETMRHGAEPNEFVGRAFFILKSCAKAPSRYHVPSKASHEDAKTRSGAAPVMPDLPPLPPSAR